MWRANNQYKLCMLDPFTAPKTPVLIDNLGQGEIDE